MKPGPRWIERKRCASRLSIPLGALFALLFSALAIAPATQAQNAQDSASSASDPFAGIEEMVVVGKSMVGTLTDASVSVTAFDSAELEALGVSDISDVAAFTPNLEIRTASSTTATFFIRGVGLNDFTANAASAVAVYVDDAPRNLPAIQLGLLYDLDGVEVLKGPQGSGPGRNASAGAIRIFTKKPTGEVGGYAKAEYGNFNLIDIEGAVETPIAEDLLAIRSSFRVQTRDGIVRNRCGGLTQQQINASIAPVCGTALVGTIRPGLEEDLNNIDRWSTRTALRFVPPVDGMEWNLVGHVDRVDQVGTVGEHLGAIGTLGSRDKSTYISRDVEDERVEIFNRVRAGFTIPTNAECRNSANPAACRALQAQLLNQVRVLQDSQLAASLAKRPLDRRPFKGDYNNPGFERQTSWGLLLDGEWQLDRVLLKSITGYETYERERLIDADYSPNVVFEFDTSDDAWQVTQDLRLEGDLEALPITWKTGAFYLQEELDYEQSTLADLGVVEPIFASFIQETWSLGVYADLSWDILDDFTLEAGARYNWERKIFDSKIARGQTRSNQCRQDPGSPAPPCIRTETVDHPTGTVSLKYRFDELRTVYLKYSHGWKGAQFNVRSVGGGQRNQVTDVADPEIIDAFELGFDGSWFDDILKLNGALFWYDYENYQVFTFSNDTNSTPVRIVINANDARVYGAELSVIVEPVETLLFELRSSWLETKFLDFTDTVARPVPGSTNQTFRQIFDFNGNSLPNAPRFKVSGGMQYTLELGRAGSWTPRYDFVWTDDVYFDPSGGTGAPNVAGDLFMPENTIGQEAFILHNLRLTWAPPASTLEVTGWIRNITNEVYKTLAFDASGGPGFVGNLVGDPRTYGASLKVSF